MINSQLKKVDLRDIITQNIELETLTSFKASHIYCFIIELFVIIYTITSVHKPIFTFIPFKRLKISWKWVYEKNVICISFS